MVDSNNAKKNVGNHAAENVPDNSILGLGTGSTALYFIEGIGKRLKEGSLKNIKGVSSSFSTNILAGQHNIPLLPLENVDHIDVYVDGADEVDPEKRLIKGRGAAMVREKILATCSNEFWCVVDPSKIVDRLGTSFPVPVEVIPSSLTSIQKHLKALGGTPILRQAQSKDGPVISDQGNFVLDVEFSTKFDFDKLDNEINQIPGVLGHGIFVNLATKIIIGSEDGVETRV